MTPKKSQDQAQERCGICLAPIPAGEYWCEQHQPPPELSGEEAEREAARLAEAANPRSA